MIKPFKGLRYTAVKALKQRFIPRRRVFTLKCGSDVNSYVKVKLKRSLNLDKGHLIITDAF